MRQTWLICAIAVLLGGCGGGGAARGASGTGGGGRAGWGGGAYGGSMGEGGSGGKALTGSGGFGPGGMSGQGVGTGGSMGSNGLPAGTLALDIAGGSQGVDYAVLKVAGKATLGGSLRLAFLNGFVPNPGDKFVVVTADGGISGTFASVITNGVAVTAGQDATSFFVTAN